MTVIIHCKTDNWLIPLYFLHLGEGDLSETLQKRKVWKTANIFGESGVSLRREGKRRSSLNCSAEAQRCCSLLIWASRKWRWKTRDSIMAIYTVSFSLAFWNKALCSPSWSRIHDVAQAGLKLQVILLLPPPQGLESHLGATMQCYFATLIN